MLTLALGIGANVAIFQLIDAVRLRTLPVKDPGRLAIVHLNYNHWGSGDFNGPYANFTFPLWEQVEQRQQSFSHLAAWGADKLNLANGALLDGTTTATSSPWMRALPMMPMTCCGAATHTTHAAPDYCGDE